MSGETTKTELAAGERSTTESASLSRRDTLRKLGRAAYTAPILITLVPPATSQEFSPPPPPGAPQTDPRRRRRGG